MDGTSDFVKRTDDFVVMIGLAIAGWPVLGAVYHPPTGTLYRGGHGIVAEKDWEGCNGLELTDEIRVTIAAQASLLLLNELGFLEADDPRFAGTVQAIETNLKQGDFLFRYTQRDDFGVPETAFTICTFWYVDALAALGRVDEARSLFEKLLACRNGLGLLSEDLKPDTLELWGNFPQTYSMVGLINSAMRLSKHWEDVF